MKIRFLLIGTSLSLIPQTINAQCVATQDCATLGYTETSCSGGNGVKCPFGNKWACFKSKEEYEQEFCTKYGFTLSCSGTNQTGGTGKACNGKYNICKCAANLTWNADTKSCEANTANFGVVIYEKSASQNGWIMTVKPIQTNIAWDTGSYYSTGITDKAVSASCTNTQKLVAKGSRFAAATAANNYKPTGTPSGKSWCLPSYDLLNNLNNSTNLTKVNAGITIAGGTILGNVPDGYENVWSSSEYDRDDAWFFFANTSGSFAMRTYGKYSDYSYLRSVRPVLAF